MSTKNNPTGNTGESSQSTTAREGTGRKVVANLFVSLDGVTQAPERWSWDYFSDELQSAVAASFAAADALLMGRVLYEEWAAVWPDRSDDPMADNMNNIAKYVVSTTLDQVNWNNSHLITGDDIAGQIRSLLAEPGKDIAISGSPRLVRWLISEGLLDELRTFVAPVVIGEGSRLFPEGTPRTALRLIRSEAFPTGVLDLTYQPSRS